MSDDRDLQPGAVRLNVADARRAETFYRETIGLRRGDEDDEVVRLGANGSTLVELVEAPDAPRRPPHTTGLFHLAILLDSREELARALHRVVRSGWSLTGASDHLVSEALYLSDPEGNGIELYRDRPRSEWRYVDGRLMMSTLPLDLDALAPEGAADPGETGAGPKRGSATCT
jgi:catechol 2,3-dioxygenase